MRVIDAWKNPGATFVQKPWRLNCKIGRVLKVVEMAIA